MMRSAKANDKLCFIVVGTGCCFVMMEVRDIVTQTLGSQYQPKMGYTGLKDCHDEKERV